MKQVVAFANALADETRWRIVQLLGSEALCVCELVDVLGLPQSTLSSHLGIIQRAGLLDAERRGKWMFYRVRQDCLPLLQMMCRQFGCSPETTPTLARDARKAASRRARRELACCPGPEKLAARPSARLKLKAKATLAS